MRVKHQKPRELDQYTRTAALKKIDGILRKLKTEKKPTQEDHYFMHQILDGVEHLFIQEIRERQARVPGLRTEYLEHVAIWGGPLSPGCQHCVDHGFAPIRSASHCNLQCDFCYYGETRQAVRLLGKDQFEIDGRPISSRELRVMLMKAVKGSGDLQSVAWVFMEPFTDVGKHPDLIAYVHELGLYQHMYTNGTLCSDASLKLLADAGLEEIRFNLAATNCSDKVIEAMHRARPLFPYMCIESPMFPRYFAKFMAKRRQILATGVSHIHCAELHLNEDNFEQYKDEELYQYSRGYISPMSSRRLTYDLMDVAAAEGWEDVAIHDCSNEVKFLRGISSEQLGGLMYASELPGLPMGWFAHALKKYPLTADA